jgi:hypothetical protein
MPGSYPHYASQAHRRGVIREPEGELSQAFWSEDPQQDALAGRDEI